MDIDVPSPLSVMVSVWMEGILYGINVVIYFTCLCVIVSRKARGNLKVQKGLLVLSTLLFASATAHMVINVQRLIDGYICSPTKAAMDEYFGDITQPLTVAQEFLIATTYLFSDLIITWRVYIVWAFDWRITLIPLLLCLTAVTASIGVSVSTAIAKPGQSIFLERIAPFGDAWICLGLVMNATATFLIASRIWWVTRRTSARGTDSSISFRSDLPSFRPGRAFDRWKRHNRQYWRLVVIIIESAACAVVMQVIQLVFFISKFSGIYFINDSVVQVMAISPLLIIALVGLTTARTGEDWSTSVSYAGNPSGNRTGRRASYGGNAASGRDVGAARTERRRLTGRRETEELPPMEFNVSSAESKSETFTGDTNCADQGISSAPQMMFEDTILEGKFSVSSKDEEVEMQTMTA